MLSRADAYRINARGCAARAAGAHDPAIKKQLEDLARQWREMAELIERDS